MFLLVSFFLLTAMSDDCYCGSGQFYKCNGGYAWNFSGRGARVWAIRGSWDEACRQCAEYARDQYVASGVWSSEKCFSCNKSKVFGYKTAIHITYDITPNVADSLFCGTPNSLASKWIASVVDRDMFLSGRIIMVVLGVALIVVGGFGFYYRKQKFAVTNGEEISVLVV